MPNWKGGIGGAASGAATGGAIGGPWGAAAGGVIGGVSGLFNDPYGDASDQENKGWNNAKHYQEPYWQGGVDQYGRLNDATGKLLDPAALQNEWSNSYEKSPYAQQLLNQNMQSGQEAASAMGLNGSSAALGNIQQGAGNIVQQDRQQYMNDLMQKYMQGIGLGNSLYGTGAQAGANLGGQSMTHGENQAKIAYGQGNAFNQQMADAAGAYGRGGMGGGTPAYANQPGWSSGQPTPGWNNR